MIEDGATIYARELLTDLDDLESYFDIPSSDESTLLEKKYNLSRFHEEKVPGKDNTGLVIGRFQPPHAGHFYLIEAAFEVANTVVVGIGSVNVRNSENPFTALKRELILRKVLKRKGLEDRVRFVYLNDYHDDEKWCLKTLEQAQQWGTIDVVVGNNGWVNNIFRKKDMRVLEIPELKRGTYQGTIIRQELRDSGALRSFI